MLALTRFEVGAVVRKTISEILAVPENQISKSTLLVEDLRASSMDLVTLAMALDERFDFEFELSELPQSNVTVDWIIEYVLLRKSSI